MPLWEPQFLNRAYGFRPLAEPKSILGGREATFLVTNKDFINGASPRVLEILSKIQLDIDTLNELDYQVNVLERDTKSLVKEWMESNRDNIEEWIQ